MKPRNLSCQKTVIPFGILVSLITLLIASFSFGYPVKAIDPLLQMANTPNVVYTIYLPAIYSSGGGSNPVPTATPPSPTATPPAQGNPIGFFLPWVIQGEAHATDGPSLAVDANGGVHVAYTAYTSDANGNRPAYYTYCPSNCTSQASFSAPVIFNGKIDHVNLALDAQGHPRIIWVGSDPLQQKLIAYVYAACNTGCTSAANWQMARVDALDNVLPHNSRFFAIDPQGRPGLIYYISGIGSVSGTYFAYCGSSCTNAANWRFTRISPAELRFPVLVFDQAGLPRIAGSFMDYTSEPALDYLVYLECDANCQKVIQGASFPIKTCFLCDSPNGYLDLAFDSNNHPRMALYTGALEAGRGLEANRLYYLFCSTNCGDWNTSDWSGYSLGLPVGVGTYARLAIDPQNRPRLVYEDVSYGLEYSWCKSGCETTSPVWQNMLADSSAVLDQTEPVPPIPPCQVAGWFTGKRPSFALDSAGNPRFAYDAEHWQGLDPIDYPPGTPGCPGFKMDQINARFTLFNQP
ncbi:MAG: hypothetical protein ACYCYG_09660 [Bellilinea sp.]